MEGTSSSRVAHSHDKNPVGEVPGVCKCLLTVHTKLESDYCPSNKTYLCLEADPKMFYTCTMCQKTQPATSSLVSIIHHYSPGSHNIKQDALFHQISDSDDSEVHDNIRHAFCTSEGLTCETEDLIHGAQTIITD